MQSIQPALFEVAAQRLAWINERQAVLAQNVANADTPGFLPQDVSPFARILAGSSTKIARTDVAHLSARPGSYAPVTTRPRDKALDSNAISIEQELTKIADTQAAQALTSNLLQRYMAMFKTTLGR